MTEQVFRPGAPISGRVTPATFPFYTTGEDNLRIVSFNSAANVKLTLSARLLGNDGRPTPSTWFHTPNTDRSQASNDFNLSGQTILNVRVVATSGSPIVGQTFVLVQLIRGIGSAAIVLGTILQGYVTTTQGLGWPGSAIASSTDGEPALRTIVGTNPAASVAGWSETVPTAARWELLTFGGSIQPVGGGASSVITLSIRDGSGNLLFQNKSAQALAVAGSAGIVFWMQGSPITPTGADGLINVPLPSGLRLLAGSVISTNANGSWDYDAPVYQVREWLDV